MANPALILGIDPGLKLTGYACISPNARNPIDHTLVEAGVIRLNPRHSLSRRLHQLHTDLNEVITEHSPGLLVVEKLFSHYKQVRTAIIMGHARGVILLAGQSHDIPLVEIAPTEVKKSTTGNGHATKRQMQLAVMAQCRLKAPPSPPDVADAIALALCAARRM
ncbi:MAG TPA: crossover junction endodeoxyribonuclease RuvC [Phycisphaerales bacterium]|nr:crossover junction endodeoxyribonuclease RuvC [Phycisphaerales bacterium]